MIFVTAVMGIMRLGMGLRRFTNDRSFRRSFVLPKNNVQLHI